MTDAPAVGRCADIAGRSLAPAFRALVLALCIHPRTRRAGIGALASSYLAAAAGKRVRERVGRRRPGPREEAGFPSRHAAAATAIARATARRHPAVGAVVGAAAAVGIAGRVQTRDHDPADLLAGAMLGAGVEAATEAAMGRVLPLFMRAR